MTFHFEMYIFLFLFFLKAPKDYMTHKLNCTFLPSGGERGESNNIISFYVEQLQQLEQFFVAVLSKWTPNQKPHYLYPSAYGME